MKKIIASLVFLFLIVTANAKTYAVIIGIATYEHPSANLRFADDDARAFYKYITENLGAASTDVSMLLDDQATKSNILSTMEDVFGKATEEDVIMFFFSGHGMPGAFTCYDSPVKQQFLYHTLVKSAFKKSKAKNKYCFADACHSGSIRTTNKEITKAKAAKGHDGLKGGTDNIVIFMSSRPEQTSLENPSIGQGFFAYYLIEAMLGNADLNKDKNITMLELYGYVRKKVMESTQNQQTPQAFGNFSKNQVVISFQQ
jgi:uncharacterized caspase-like protein